MKTRQEMEARRIKVRRQLKIIETLAWIVCEVCIVLMILTVASIDSRVLQAAFVVFIGAALSCWLAYKAAMWAHDKEV